MWAAIRHSFTDLTDGMTLLKSHRELIFEMARRELIDQYAGQALGFLWAILHPMILVGVYIFIFGVVFKARIGGTHEMPLDYTCYILAGLVPWLGFQTSLIKSCTALTSQSNLVQQVVFPTEVLPIKMVLSSFTGQLFSFIVLLIYVVCKYGLPMPSYFLLPVLLFFQFLAMLGIGYILAAITPFFRDLKDFVTVFAVVGIYLIPVVYLPSWVPGLFKPILYLNPVSYMIWCYQDVLYFGRIDHPIAWVVFMTTSILLFLIGYRFFRRLKPFFGNVL